jgi:hypothetical protein
MALKYNLHEDSYLPKERKITKNGFTLRMKVFRGFGFCKKKSPAI